jgi:hypothetical protein
MKNLTRFLIRFFSGIVLPFVLTITAFAVSAQTCWLPDATDKGVGVEWLKPSLSEDDETSFLSSASTLTGRFRVGEKLVLAGELPFAYFNAEYMDAELAVGNPYLGVIFNKENSPYFLEAGFRAPIASEDKYMAFFYSYLADFDRSEAYMPDVWSISVKNHYLKRSESGVFFKLMGGFSYWLPRESEYSDPEGLFDYGGHLGYEAENVQVFGGMTGRIILTESDIDFKEATVNHFALFARYKGWKVQPGVVFKVPVDDDYSEIVSYVIGLNALIPLD